MAEHDRLVIVLSDIEMSSGDIFDDFPHTQFLAELINKYNGADYQNIELDLVFNGDTFDFLKIEVDGNFPHLIDREVALRKFEIIKSAHLDFFQSINRFIDHGKMPRRVHFIVGNHDMELVFPEIQNELVRSCGGSGQILFPGFELTIGDLHIEHGNQIDSLFSVDPSQTFLLHQNKRILNLPWATVTLLNVIMPHRSQFYQLDRIKPRGLVFDKLPGMKDFVMGQLWSYWTKDYLRSNDPLKKISWGMVKQAFRRSLMFNPDVEIEDKLFKRMKKFSDYKLYVIGHMHDTKVSTHGNRKLVQLGCFRDEFMYEDESDSFHLIPKTYLEVKMINNQVSTSDLLELALVNLPEERIPTGYSSYELILSEKLLDAAKLLKDKEAIKQQEEKEGLRPSSD